MSTMLHEDVARVVFKNGRELTVLLRHPTKPAPGYDHYGVRIRKQAEGDEEEYENEEEYEDVSPKFAVTSQGFRCFASKSVEASHEHEAEPFFHGSIQPARGYLPRYEISVKL